MAIFGNGSLSVRVSAATRSFEEGMDDAQTSLADFGAGALTATAPLEALGRQADDVEGEVDALGRSSLTTAGALGTLGGTASGTTGAMTSFGIGTEGAGFSVRSLSGSIMFALIPALTVLSSTLAPILAALGGFVAVGGAFAGIGIVGTVAAIAERTELLREAFDGLVSELRTAFAPAIDMAAEVLLVLMDEFRDIIPALVPAQDVLSEIGGAFAGLGEVLIQSLPMFVDLATTLTTRFLPPFTMWLEDILPRLPGMVMSFVSAMDRMIPRFREAGRLLVEMGPPLLEFGFAALNVVGPALADLTQGLSSLLGQFNSLDPALQNLITRVALFAPVMILATSLISSVIGLFGSLISVVSAAAAGFAGGGGIIGALAAVATPLNVLLVAIGALAAAWKTNFGNIRGVVQQTWQRLQSVLGENLPTLIENVKTILDTILPVIEPIFNALLQIAGTVLVNAFDSLVSVLTAVSQILTGDFAGAWETIEGLIRRTIGRLIDLINTLTGGAFGQALSVIEGVAGAVNVSLPNQQPTLGPGPQGVGAGAGGPSTVNVNVTGDTGVIEDVAVETTRGEFQAREDRNRRLANR